MPTLRHRHFHYAIAIESAAIAAFTGWMPLSLRFSSLLHALSAPLLHFAIVFIFIDFTSIRAFISSEIAFTDAIHRMKADCRDYASYYADYGHIEPAAAGFHAPASLRQPIASFASFFIDADNISPLRHYFRLPPE
jgi:hypothetical protein